MATATATKANPYADLPRIVLFEGVSDAGEFGAAHCPHCGAEGRYVYAFRCEDGSRRRAMKGCLAKFPVHPFAKRQQRIMDKQREIEDTNRKLGRDRKLASWDQAVLDAVDAYAHAELSEEDAWTAINRAESRKAAWMKSRGYRR